MMSHEASVGTSPASLFLGLANRRFIRAALLACFAIAAAFSMPTPARAWACEGHQVIALLAEKHLTPNALAAVNRILKENPIDPSLNRFCKQGGIDAIADSSTWADDFRTVHPDTGPWHYIDIRPDTTLRDGAKNIDAIVEEFCDPQESCLTRATADQFAILRSAHTDSRQKADALRFVIHFVGDLHQPLHNIANNDQGGNCVPLTYFDTLPHLTNPRTETYAPNLHGIWDYGILTRATMGETVDQVAADLDLFYRRQIAGWQKAPANFDAWSWESFQIAMKIAYGKLPVRIPVEAPLPVHSCADDNHVSERLLKLNERIEQPYQDIALPVVRERLAQAGARLAMVLNQVWP
jgi:hypothetical protein